MHFAEINPATNEVLRVIVCDSKEWCEKNLGGTWARTYYSTVGKNYAGYGYTYHPDRENFSAPQPYASWTLNDALIWQAPVSYPDDGKIYSWNEAEQAWVEIVESESITIS